MSYLGYTATPPLASSRGGPVQTPEFNRILHLPRYETICQELDQDIMTQALRSKEGTWKLNRIQTIALDAIREHAGLFGPIVVGGGKTLITLLSATVVKVHRPLLLIPASLREQTLNRVLPEMRKHWYINENLKVLAYSELSLVQNKDILNRLQPDMIIADECHLLRNLKSARTRRVARYMDLHPMTPFIAVSGTIANHSIMHYWHIIQWALKPLHAPVPCTFYEAKEWANALDERVHELDRTGPGVLVKLCEGNETPREGYRRRLVSTGGVVATSSDELGVSLQVTGYSDIKVPTRLQKVMQRTMALWETPDGDIILEAVAMWRILRQLALGFYYKWDPKPPDEWLEARKVWNKYVRHRLSTNRKQLDTPLQVAQEANRLGLPEYLKWKDIKDTYIPNTTAVWVSDFILDYASKWLYHRGGICWVEHTVFGEELAKYSGFPFYTAGDTRILGAKHQAIASISAHGTGKNLQQWHENLVVCPPTSGSKWEQLIGRTHRHGQLEDTVYFDVLLHHRALKTAMDQAFLDAEFLEQSLGNRQRLLYCDTNIERRS